MSGDPNRIRELRRAAGLSQQALGDAIGVSKMTISDLERGSMELTLTYMQRLAPVLKASPAEMLPAKDNPWQLSTSEQELLRRYRDADDGRKETILRVTEAISPFEQDVRKAG